MNLLDRPWNLIFIAGLVCYISIRHIYELRSKKTRGEQTNQPNRNELVLIVIMTIGGLIIPTLYLLTNWFSFADYHLPSILPWIGTSLMLLALWLFWRSHSDLGKNWSVTLEIQKDHQLIQYGVYRLVRHPMYAAIWLFSFAQGLLLQNWLSGWSAFAAFALMYFIRIPREEKMMLEYFGQEYLDYMRQTERIFPRLFGNRKEV